MPKSVGYKSHIRMRIYWILMVCFIGILGKAFSQQDPHFSLPYYNQMSFNPSVIGSKNCMSATLTGNFQMIGVRDAPMNWTFGLDMPFAFGKTRQNAIGFGIVGYGVYEGTSSGGAMRFAINYKRCKLGPGDLAFGIDLGLATRRFNNPLWIIPPEHPDTNLPDPNMAGEAFDMGIGISYTGDNFYAGVSCTHLNAGSISTMNYTFNKQMYFNGGGFIPMGPNKNWRLNPNAFVRTDFATVNFNVGINALCYFNENKAMIFGSSYRYTDVVGINIGYAMRFKEGKKGMMLIGYNMDLHTSRFGMMGTTSHELVLRFCFQNKDVKFQRIFL